MSYARDVLGYCDQASPNTDRGIDVGVGIWCTEPAGHDGPHRYYGLLPWCDHESPA